MMKKQMGQVALIVLVISAISLTVGLALSGKIRTGVKISKDDELLQKAFNAAESTLESYYARGDTSYTTLSGDAVGSLIVEDIDGVEIQFEKFVRAEEYAFFWLVGHNDDGTINYSDRYAGSDLSICFNNFHTPASPGGLMIYYFYGDQSGYYVNRQSFNLNGGEQSIQNASDVSFDASPVCDGYNVSVDYGLPNVNPLLLVIKPIGGGSNFAVSGDNFPSQGKALPVTASSGAVNVLVKEENRWDPTKYMFFMLEGIVSRNTIN